MAVKVHGSLINDWVKLTPLFSGHPYDRPPPEAGSARLIGTLKRLTEEKKK